MLTVQGSATPLAWKAASLKVLEKEKIPIDLIVGTSIGALVGAAYALKPDAKTLEARFSEVLDPKGNLNTGLKLLGKVQWDVGSKSDFLRRIVRIAQKKFWTLPYFAMPCCRPMRCENVWRPSSRMSRLKHQKYLSEQQRWISSQANRLFSDTGLWSGLSWPVVPCQGLCRIGKKGSITRFSKRMYEINRK